MDDAGPPGAAGKTHATQRNNLTLRIVSAAILAPIALLTAYVGGWLFAAVWTGAGIVVFFEWTTIVGERRTAVMAIGVSALVAAGVLAGLNEGAYALAAAGVGLAAVAAVAGAGRRAWCAGGLAYAGSVVVAPVALRSDPVYGLHAILILFAVVWTTDIFAYVVGRLCGGPRLAPAISPGKTISGAVGGCIGAVVVAVVVALAAGLPNAIGLAFLALGLSIVSQAGDLGESAIKRVFRVKDAGHIIPGHGGLMDRLDGFQAAIVVAAAIGVVRAGPQALAHGLILW